MDVSIMKSLSGIVAFLQYFGAGIVLLVVFIVVYGLITPYREFGLIKEGKTAPAISFGGAILGYVFPMYNAIAHSVNLLDMIIWATIALVVQIAVFLVLRVVFHSIIKDIADDKTGPAIFVAFVSIAIGILNAACMTY